MTRTADMRYAGQGHQISVSIPLGKLTLSAATLLKETFDDVYGRQYGQIIPGIDIEVLSWTVTIAHTTGRAKVLKNPELIDVPPPATQRHVVDASSGNLENFFVYARAELRPGMEIKGPALIIEDETTTLVSSAFDAQINSAGYIVLHRRETE